MIEIRFHGRGGQGTVTAAEMLAKAAGHDGKYVQAFPSFGTERRGSPVRAFCRIDDKPITIRSQVYEPDYLVVLEPSLLDIDVKEGMKKGSVLVINSDKTIANVNGRKAYSFDATKLALDTIGKDIVNTAILGSFAKVTKLVTLDSLLKVVAEKFPGKLGELNANMVREAYEKTKI
ncbi:MAG: pyruvate ferredoxin oxidoreductase subunit gamma [Candidatus Aenigmarchaeota archaeon]|nr:pyruvate ferredoxin oxidoreductase subunit gamma [Candidatus Aenigmarchaeota archaeon]